MHFCPAGVLLGAVYRQSGCMSANPNAHALACAPPAGTCFLLMSTSRQDLYCCFLLLSMSAMFPLCFCPCTLCSALTACPLPRLPHPILITSTHSVSGKEAPPADERVSMWLQSSLCILCLMPTCWWNNKAVKNCMRCAHEGRFELPGKCMVPSYLPA